MASANAAAAHVFLSVTRFRELVDAGTVTKRAAGQYDLDVVRKEVLTHLRSKASGHGGGGVGLATERAALAREQTQAVSIKNAISRGDYTSLAQIKRSVIAMFATFRERVLSIPGKIADACAMRTREEIEDILRSELYEALDELHDPTADGTSGYRSDVVGGPAGTQAAA